MGRCGKSVKEAALTSYEEYLYLREGKVAEDNERWKVARWMCWYEEQLSPYIKKKHGCPEDLFLLHGEKRPVKSRPTGKIDDGTIAQLTGIYDEFYRRKNIVN